MGDPNEPRLLRPPRPFARVKDDHVSGNAARDGFTVRAAARRQQPFTSEYGEYCGPGEISPQIGQRVYGTRDADDSYED